MPPRKSKPQTPPIVHLSTLRAGDTFVFPDGYPTGRVLMDPTYGSVRVQLTWPPRNQEIKPTVRVQNIAPGAEVIHTGHRAIDDELPLDPEAEV